MTTEHLVFRQSRPGRQACCWRSVQMSHWWRRGASESNTALGSVLEGGYPNEEREEMRLLTVSVTCCNHSLPPEDSVVSAYELSRASNTFMICCLMTFVASPAFGIKYLSTADISTPAELLVPNLKVISSGCFFLDVIFTTELSACLDWM